MCVENMCWKNVVYFWNEEIFSDDNIKKMCCKILEHVPMHHGDTLPWLQTITT